MGESVRGTRDVADAKSALNLRPFPNRSELLEQLTGIMSPLVPAPELLGDAPVRSVGGLGQVMHAESRYVSILPFSCITALLPCLVGSRYWENETDE